MSPVLFILPQGATIGGVTTWACAAAGLLAERGHDSALLVHGRIEAHAEVRTPLDPAVRLIADPCLPAPSSLEGRIEPIVERYTDHARLLVARRGEPVVLIPTRDADCFAACVAVAARHPDLVRVLGWRHSPMPYEREIFARYAPGMSRMVAVSDELADELRRLHPGRAADIARVHNAVLVPPTIAPRPAPVSRPLCLIYAGRLDEPIKRVAALVSLSDALHRFGIDHELMIVGDGPAHASLAALAATRPAIALLGALDPARVGSLLDRADVFVLPSRVEGLSLAALEGMAHGCALAVTRTPSGAEALIGDDEAGLIADAGPDATPEQAGQALAECVLRLMHSDVSAIGARAHRRAQRLFSLDRSADAVARQVELAAQAPRPALDKPIAPFHSATRPASVPPEAGELLHACLISLVGRRIAVFGCGTHTRALHAAISASHANVVALSDDDPSTHGTLVLGLPVVAPERLAATGATDLVISSWMHEDAIFARRHVFERQGLRVHRLYAAPLRRPA